MLVSTHSLLLDMAVSLRVLTESTDEEGNHEPRSCPEHLE
jgi:hypothetical protein